MASLDTSPSCKSQVLRRRPLYQLALGFRQGIYLYATSSDWSD